MKTIVSVCSARPNFVKVAAVHHAILEHHADTVRHIIVHTGQHYDPLFSDIFFEQLSIPEPAYNLEIRGGTQEEVIAATEAAFAKILPDIHPDIVLVYGDVNGAVGAAKATKATGYRLGHVEAGLRSFDLDMPEERNRLAIDAIADILFCSEGSGVDHLKGEGIKGEILLVGNTMIDTLIRMMPFIDTAPLPIALDGPFAVATLHRPSNVDNPNVLRETLSFLSVVARTIPLILPAHHRLMASINTFGFGDLVDRHIQLINPLGYIPFLRLVKDTSFLLTDSGGIQEEAAFLRKRCFTLRLNTERPSTIESGSNTLVSIDRHADRHMILDYAAKGDDRVMTPPDLWDGKAAVRILTILQTIL
jgi:UDP-N-acetylglucosamine 2-epimerase (non-hydrolysing)